jgi:DNA polymerase-3 subunit beta
MFTIKTNELKALLLCAGKKDIRYYLNGVHFESTPHGIIAASTDGHRLLCINLPSEQAEGIKALIPRPLIEAAVKTKAPTIDITIEGANVTLASAGPNVSGGLTDATFPGYRRVIPEKVSGSITDGVFPDFRRVIPNSVSGIQGNEFNNEYLVDFDKIGKLVNGGKASVLQNDVGFSALVHFDNENVIGVLMPFKHELPTSLTRPAWLDLPAAPMQAAA